MCVCAEGINSSLNRPSHAHRVSSGNGLKWSDFLTSHPWGVRFPTGVQGLIWKTIWLRRACPPEQPQPTAALCSTGCFYSSKACSVTEQPPFHLRGRKRGERGILVWGFCSLRGGGGFPAGRPPGRGSVLGFGAAPGLLEGRMLITIINKCRG